MKVLVISPHPDDEVLGCGGTIAKYLNEGVDVFLCIVTKAYTPEWSNQFLRNRPKEIQNVNRILGIKKTYLLDFPTVKLDTIPQKDLNDALANVVNKIKPNIVYIPSKGDLNKDHRIVFECALTALRPITHKVGRILTYETLSETEWGRPIESFAPNVYIDISDTFNKKIESMKAYKSEIRKYPHPRSIKGIEILARKRGFEIGVEYAEAFMLIREIKV